MVVSRHPLVKLWFHTSTRLQLQANELNPWATWQPTTDRCYVQEASSSSLETMDFKGRHIGQGLTHLTSVVPHGDWVVVGGISAGTGRVGPDELAVGHQVEAQRMSSHQLLHFALSQRENQEMASCNDDVNQVGGQTNCGASAVLFGIIQAVESLLLGVGSDSGVSVVRFRVRLWSFLFFGFVSDYGVSVVRFWVRLCLFLFFGFVSDYGVSVVRFWVRLCLFLFFGFVSDYGVSVVRIRVRLWCFRYACFAAYCFPFVRFRVGLRRICCFVLIRSYCSVLRFCVRL